MRERGYRAEVVERRVPYANKTRDLFGIVDILCVGPGGETVAIQATSGTNVSHRLRKIEDSDALADIRRAGWTVLIHGWRKNSKGRWQLREVDIS